jgi:hypothetical protein
MEIAGTAFVAHRALCRLFGTDCVCRKGVHQGGDPSILAHHATAGGDVQRILRYAPAAAAESSRSWIARCLAFNARSAVASIVLVIAFLLVGTTVNSSSSAPPWCVNEKNARSGAGPGSSGSFPI